MDFGLLEKVALVTAASKGLGRACALALAAEGAQVMIAARHQEALLLTAREIEERTGSRVLACPADVSRRADLESLVTKTLEAFGGIDILVHNTGGPPMGTFVEVTDEQWQVAFEIELLSAVRLVRLALPSSLFNTDLSSLHQAFSGSTEPYIDFDRNQEARTGTDE